MGDMKHVTPTFIAEAEAWWSFCVMRDAVSEALFGWMRAGCPCGHAEKAHNGPEFAFRWCHGRDCQCQEYRGE